MSATNGASGEGRIGDSLSTLTQAFLTGCTLSGLRSLRSRPRGRGIYWFLLLTLVCVQPAFAQTWNYAGPYAVPSRILSVTADPRSDSVVYVVASGGGI